jgi:3-deoxy-D-manno-octulosonic-acid transferase
VTVLYTIGILLYSFGVRIAALFGNAKAMQWVKGRKKQGSLSLSKGPAEQVKSDRTALRQAQGPASSEWIWFHAASLGEFEQGRPVIEALKKEFPQYKILLSFFSPSGYEIRKDYPLADEVLYLPSDTPRHAAQWVQRHHFVAAFFIKYEFWFNYMRALKDAGIPLFYISLILKPDSYFFRWYGGWFFRQLKNHITHFFVQDDTTAQLLQSNGLTTVTVCGDTRFDRVAAIAQQAKPFPEVEQFISGRHCIIAGSTWPPDEKLLVDFYQQLPEDYCLILAPHDISESHVAQIKTLFPDSQLYTELDADQPSRSLSPEPAEGSKGRPAKILIINTIGILSQLYQYARFVYIGGGFGVNIHNIQEPVTFGCPVVFGPKYKSFKEAVDLVGLEGAFPVQDAGALGSAFERLMHDEGFYAKASETCRNYLNSQVGATESILKGFKKVLFS